MKYIDEFRDFKLLKSLSQKIAKITPSGDIRIMEVCGTHTHNFFRFGLQHFLPKNITLISGPGCPVCVSSQRYIDQAIAYSKSKDTIILTFGDMLRVPGSVSTLEKARAEGADIRITYSPWEIISLAEKNPAKKIIFLSVGFETTAPAIALTVLAIHKQGIKNALFFTSLKLITPAMSQLLKDRRVRISGFLCPGHVSAIIGTKDYAFIPKNYKIGCCVAGFEPVDILEGLYLLIKQINDKKPQVANQYNRVVEAGGNSRAKKIISQVFIRVAADWRGLGVIKASGLRLRKQFAALDAEKKLLLPPAVMQAANNMPKLCRCGMVLKGLITPRQCPLFGVQCTPDSAVGPCMISSEGACNAHYRYRS